MIDPQFDVFLSHNSQDKVAVEHIAQRLEQQKEPIKVWLDKWEIIPGKSSIDEIERGLKASRTCVVCLGQAGMGPWHELERRSLLDRIEADQSPRV